MQCALVRLSYVGPLVYAVFHCEVCKQSFGQRWRFVRHLQTQKHLSNVEALEIDDPSHTGSSYIGSHREVQYTYCVITLAML